MLIKAISAIIFAELITPNPIGWVIATCLLIPIVFIPEKSSSKRPNLSCLLMIGIALVYKFENLNALYNAIQLALAICSIPYVNHVTHIISGLYSNNVSKTQALSPATTLKEKIVIAISSVTSMGLVAQSSPLYPINYWDDVNLFFTMGRGVINGLIPYKDLYEQKGPLLYFIHALCALISDTSFVGVFVLECVLSYVFVLFSWKIVKLFVKPTETSTYVVPLLTAMTYSISCFRFGGSTEEMAFSLLAPVLYIALKSINSKTLPSNKECLAIGLISGAIFWIKYSLLGFIVAYVVFILVVTIKDRQIKALFRLVGIFLAGVVVITIPVLIYFAANHALTDLFTAYFYNNLFLYSAQIDYSGSVLGVPVIGKLLLILSALGATLRDSYIFLIVFLLEMLIITCIPKRARNLYLLALAIICATVFGGNFVMFYYGYVLMVLAPFGWITATLMANATPQKFKKVVPVISIIATLLLLVTNKNLIMILQPKDSLPQYKFAQTMSKTQDPKILTFDVMDSGFYLAANQLPSNKYFCFLNIKRDLPELEESQLSLIEEGYFDYIITYSDEFDWEGYELIQTETCVFPERNGDVCIEAFYLYEKCS